MPRVLSPASKGTVTGENHLSVPPSLLDPVPPPVGGAPDGGPGEQRPRTLPPWALWLGVTGVATAALVVWLTTKTTVKPPETVAAFKATSDSVKLTPGVKQPMKFVTAPVEEGAPLRRPPLTARVAPMESRTSPVYAPLEGRVVRSAVRLGDKVKAGDKLVEIRSGDLASMQRDIQSSLLAVKTKQAMVDRLQKLVDARAASLSDLLVAQSELSEAKLGVSASAAKLNSLTIQQQSETSYWVIAARAGTVVQLDSAPGKEVGPDKDKPVATISDIDEVVVVVDVPDRDISEVSLGGGVTIRQLGATTNVFHGVVDSVAEVVDPDRQTIPVRIRVPNQPHSLKPNAFVEAVFEPAMGKVVTLAAADAVVTDGTKAVVFVETSQDHFEKRLVQIGRQTAEKAELLSGVKAGERVVVRGALLLLASLDEPAPAASAGSSAGQNQLVHHDRKTH